MMFVLAITIFALAHPIAGSQILYQPSLSTTFVAHQELPFTVQYAGKTFTILFGMQK